MSTNATPKRHTGHRARLALSPEQVSVLDDQAHAARTLWNLLHAWWTMASENRRVDLKDADAAIKQARKEIGFLKALPAQAAQAVLKTYFQAWRNCWDRRAEEPTFKSRLRSQMVVDIPQGRDLHLQRVHRRWGMVNIPKLGRVRFRWTKDLPVGKRANKENRVTGARLVKDALGWHISFRVQTLEPVPESHPGPEVGIDAGIAVPLALSDGTTYDHHRPRTNEDGGRADRDKWLNQSEKQKLASLEKQAAHQRSFRARGERISHRLVRTYDQIKALRAKATRRHLDWQHKTTTDIATRYGTVVVEALDITNMVRSARGTIEQPGKNVAQKAGLNRAIGQEAWGRTVTLLGYKLAQRGGTLYKVPAPGTSQRCSECLETISGSRGSQAVFVCKNPACGWSGNADHNAARNVLHLFRAGHVLVPAAGRAVGRRAGRVKPATAR
ncbi:RNA-guided endonuclease InsQ/TnpB family protein [Nocardiopsis metallicus]|uniref:Putative transposase n=1 Tax=Nocardiopsis metallicus TaxID=179819 RepID=A0A840VY54_9ACTN|nr:RNA-guided endonuclease TnpB family protein [Nocardiopsis metallicus]MBB5489400.1 putative transposase [Nocardiopsis metallicus]